MPGTGPGMTDRMATVYFTSFTPVTFSRFL